MISTKYSTLQLNDCNTTAIRLQYDYNTPPWERNPNQGIPIKLCLPLLNLPISQLPNFPTSQLPHHETRLVVRHLAAQNPFDSVTLTFAPSLLELSLIYPAE